MRMSAWSRITETRAKFLFFPITIFYWGVIFWRNFFYNLNFFVSRRVPAKVISIGNLVEGVKVNDIIHHDSHAGNGITWKDKLYHVITIRDVVIVE